MDIAQIKETVLLILTFLNFILAVLLWLRGKDKITFHLGWMAFFFALYSFSWIGLYIFENYRVLFAKLTSIGYFASAAYFIFVYYFTGRTKNIKLKFFLWYFISFLFLFFTLTTSLFITNSLSPEYPYVIPETAGPLNFLYRIYLIFVIFLTLFYLLKEYQKSQEERKLQIKYFLFGLIIFSIGAGLTGGIIPLFYPQSYGYTLPLSAFFSIFWIGFTTYAILKKELFSVKVVLTEILVIIISLILLTQSLLTPDLSTKIFNFTLFFSFALIGYLLIKSTYAEVKKKEESEKLTEELKKLNFFLEERVKERTAELEEKSVSFEIKVKARTKELEELTEGLDERVKKRTKELEESRRSLINILEEVELTSARAEEEKNKTLSIIENFTDGLMVFDEKDKLILINPQAEKFFETKVERVLNKSLTELLRFPDFQSLVNLIGKEIKFIFRNELAMGKNLILEVSTIPFIRAKERTGTLVILHNITREKIIEQMKSEFVSVTAHQLRTPLSAIKWTLRMLLDGDLGKITEEQKDFLEKTYKSNEKMINIINDLLDVTRIEEGRYLYKPILIDLEEVVNSVVKSYQEEIKKRKLKLELQKPTKKLPKILLDVEKIKLAIENLLDNAIRYSLPDGLLTISLNYTKKELMFSIKDSGIGIPEDQKERIFTKFFRGANVIKLETEGTGLGLFIAKNIIEAHSGKIWFESKEGRGTTFHFALPVAVEK